MFATDAGPAKPGPQSPQYRPQTARKTEQRRRPSQAMPLMSRRRNPGRQHNPPPASRNHSKHTGWELLAKRRRPLPYSLEGHPWRAGAGSVAPLHHYANRRAPPPCIPRVPFAGGGARQNPKRQEGQQPQRQRHRRNPISKRRWERTDWQRAASLCQRQLPTAATASRYSAVAVVARKCAPVFASSGGHLLHRVAALPENLSDHPERQQQPPPLATGLPLSQIENSGCGALRRAPHPERLGKGELSCQRNEGGKRQRRPPRPTGSDDFPAATSNSAAGQKSSELRRKAPLAKPPKGFRFAVKPCCCQEGRWGYGNGNVNPPPRARGTPAGPRPPQRADQGEKAGIRPFSSKRRSSEPFRGP